MTAPNTDSAALHDPEGDEVADRLHAGEPATRATLRTSAWPAIAPTFGSAKPCTSARIASGSSTLSESTKATISASVARMPAAIAARLPRFSGKSITRTRRLAGGDRSDLGQRAVGGAVVDDDDLELLGG